VKASIGALIAVTLMLGGCGEQKSSKEATPTINSSMTGVMEPTAQTIWDIVSSAYNAKGDALDATKLSDGQWKQLSDASHRLHERAQMLAMAEHILVAADNEPILGSQAAGVKGGIGPAWDAASAKVVQARIDAKPELFAQKARDLANAAEAINRAANSKDIALLYKISSNLDEVCDACHEPFWGTDEPPPFPKNH
jgi:hypothetical protein